MAMQHKVHQAWLLFPAWGHMTSAIALFEQMAHANPNLVVTFVTHNINEAKIETAISSLENFPKSQFRLAAVGSKQLDYLSPTFMQTVMKELFGSWFETLEGFYQNKDSELPPPSAIQLDFSINPDIVHQTREIAGPGVKVLIQYSPSAACLWSIIMPGTHDGFNDWDVTTDKIYNDPELCEGREKDEIADAVARVKNGSDKFTGKITIVPGLKPMYDYEREMDNCPNPSANFYGFLRTMSKAMTAGDGIVCATSMALEGSTIEELNKYHKIYAPGLQVGSRGWKKSGLKLENPKISSFLDKQAPQSTIFISFGSMFFPARCPRDVTIMLDVLTELKFPFLFLLAGPLATKAIPPEQVEKINAAGVGHIVTTWLDQQAVLQHPSVGWFLTHGGWNSAAETLVQGVPTIGWPLAHCDQAINVAMMATRDQPLGFELMQIRQGDAKAKAYRGGNEITGTEEDVRKEFVDVFTKARGPEGEVIRKNMQAFSEELRKEKEGAALKVVQELAAM